MNFVLIIQLNCQLFNWLTIIMNLIHWTSRLFGGGGMNVLESYLMKRLRIIIHSKLKQSQGFFKGPLLAHYCIISTIAILFLLVERLII